MAWIPDRVQESVKKAGVKIDYMDRVSASKSGLMRKGQIRNFCGFYWSRTAGRRILGNVHGPFRSESAAVQDAYLELVEQRLVRA